MIPQSILKRTKGQRELNVQEQYALMIDALGSSGDVLGRTFDVYDASGELVYTVKQRPLNPLQRKALSEGFNKVAEQKIRIMAAGVAKGIAVAMSKDKLD